MRIGAIRCAVDVSPCDFGILDVLSLRIEHIVRRAVLNMDRLAGQRALPGLFSFFGIVHFDTGPDCIRIDRQQFFLGHAVQQKGVVRAFTLAIRIDGFRRFEFAGGGVQHLPLIGYGHIVPVQPDIQFHGVAGLGFGMGKHFGDPQRRKGRSLAVALRAGRALRIRCAFAAGCGIAVRHALALRRGAAVRCTFAVRRGSAVRYTFALRPALTFRFGTAVCGTLVLLWRVCTGWNIISLRGNAFRHGIVWRALVDRSGRTF